VIYQQQGEIMNRKYVDCREQLSESKCSLRISGLEDEVVRASIEHAVSVHREKDTPEFREEVRKSLKDEPQAQFEKKSSAA